MEYRIDDWLKDIVLEATVDILMCLLEPFRTSCYVIEAVEFHIYALGETFPRKKTFQREFLKPRLLEVTRKLENSSSVKEEKEKIGKIFAYC